MRGSNKRRMLCFIYFSTFAVFPSLAQATETDSWHQWATTSREYRSHLKPQSWRYTFPVLIQNWSKKKKKNQKPNRNVLPNNSKRYFIYFRMIWTNCLVNHDVCHLTGTQTWYSSWRKQLRPHKKVFKFIGESGLGEGVHWLLCNPKDAEA